MLVFFSLGFGDCEGSREGKPRKEAGEKLRGFLLDGLEPIANQYECSSDG